VTAQNVATHDKHSKKKPRGLRKTCWRLSSSKIVAPHFLPCDGRNFENLVKDLHHKFPSINPFKLRPLPLVSRLSFSTLDIAFLMSDPLRLPPPRPLTVSVSRSHEASPRQHRRLHLLLLSPLRTPRPVLLRLTRRMEANHGSSLLLKKSFAASIRCVISNAMV
jgi:hypothetical protein